jgi:hypothetical protein
MEKKKVEDASNKEAETKEDDKKKDDFVKEGEKADANKYNQALRKAREAEAQKRELEEELAKVKKTPAKKETPPQKKEEKKEEEDDEDDFWKEDDDKKEKKVDPNQAYDPEYIKSLVDEKIKPFMESESKRIQRERRNARSDFYDSHPEYLEDPDKWAELLDEMNGSIRPSGDYYQDLEKAHRILGGEDSGKTQIERKQREIANQAGNSGGNTQKTTPKGQGDLDSMDKKVMEGTGVSAETIEAMKDMQKKGLLSLEW